MKKLICLVLFAIIALSLVACASTPNNQASPSPETSESVSNHSAETSESSSDSSAETSENVSNPPAETSENASNPPAETSGEDDAAAAFPLVFTPKWSLENVKTEDNPDGTLAYGYGSFAYDAKEEIVLEYCKVTDELFVAINGYSDWPTELNDTWRSYGYVGIDNNEKGSIRTLAVGKFNEKHAKVIMDYESAMYKSGFEIDDMIKGSPKEEGKKYVNYCMLTTEDEVTINQIATAAYNALYLQAWHLIPADNQGVLVSANGRTYTVSDILKELAD